jgi:orotidine 5'-phosphate decarboxylase subfamily 1
MELRLKLDNIIKSKRTRICFSADFSSKVDLYYWINLFGPLICILKTHIDILEDFDETVIIELLRLKNKYNFLIFEDRKFSDIGKIFLKQLTGGIYKISSWADIVTIHGITCDGMLNTLVNAKVKTPNVLIVSQMSSSNNLITKEYTDQCYKIALKYKNNVLGFISQKRFINDNNFLFMTPGVKIIKENSKKEMDQNYRTPLDAMNKDGNDIIIVGSGLYNIKKNSDFNKNIMGYKNF